MSQISPGDNTVRIAGFHKTTHSIYDYYQFEFINQSGNTHGIAYCVPAGLVPPRIVRDLLELRKKKLWFTVYLKEKNGKLMIFTIKEPKEPQEFYNYNAKMVLN